MTLHSSGRGERVELGLLCCVLFVLPTLEAPKTLALVSYFIVWVIRRFPLTGLRRYRPDAVEIALYAVLAAGLASTLANWPFSNGTKGLSDTLRYVALFLCICHGRYTETQHRALAHAITWGALVGLVAAVAELAMGRRPALELHSAGVVTQSAMYVSMALMLAVAIYVTRWLPPELPRTPRARSLWFWGTAIAAMLLALAVMASRGAFLAVMVSMLLLAVMVNRAKLWGAIVAFVVFALAAILVVGLDTNMEVGKSLRLRLSGERLAQSNIERYENYRVAFAQIRQGGAPWLGIGPRNYASIDLSSFEFDPPLQLEGPTRKLNHAHNLFLTKWVEEGLVGVAVFILFWVLVARTLFRAWREGRWYEWRWIAAFGALSVSLLAGSVNTPFYQEHALLAMSFLAIYMASRRFGGVASARAGGGLSAGGSD